MKNLTLIIVFLFFGVFLSAQSPKTDSLKQLLTTHPEKDSVRARLLGEMGHNLLFTNPKEARKYYEELLDLGNLLGSFNNKGTAYNALGVINCMQGNYDDGLAFYIKGVEEFKAAGNDRSLASANLNIAGIYIYIGEYEKAIVYIQNSLKIYKASGDVDEIGTSHQALGIVYENLFREAAQEDVELRNEMIAKTQDNFRKALEIYEQTGNQKEQSICLTNLGKFNYDLENYEEAIKYELKALKLKGALNLKSMSYSYLILGDSYRLQKKLKQAESNLLEAYQLARKGGLKEDLQKTTKSLYLLYAETNEYEQFSKFHEENETLRLAFLDQEQNKQVLELKERYETKKKEEENLQLQIKANLIESRSNLFALLMALLFTGLLISIYLYYRLRKNKRKLEAINAAKNQLFGIMAHDLKGPAASFHNLSRKISYLLRQNDPERLLDFANHFEKAGNRINYVLNNLLDWAVSQKDEFVHDPQRINVKEYLNLVTQNLEYALSEKKITVKNQLDAELLCTFDKNALIIITRNLLHNAIKYSYPNSTIQICSDQVEGEKRMLIIDKGVGMTPEQSEKILSGFFLQSQLGTKSEKGNGLGLSTCMKLVAKNESKIAIKSTPGKGTTIILNLPEAN